MQFVSKSAAPPSAPGPVGLEPLTILHVIAPARVGGLERVVHALAAGHARRGHSVHVAVVLSSDEPDHPLLLNLDSAGVGVHRILSPGRGYRRERAAVREIIRRVRPEVVHTHGYRTDVVDAGVARALGIPIITTVHGFTRGGWKNRSYEWLQKRALRRFDAVVAVSKPQIDEIVRAGVRRERVHPLPNAWAPTGAGLAPADAREVLGVPPDCLHLGWVGRLSYEKGADILLEALPLLSDQQIVLSVIGDGGKMDHLRAQAESMNVEDRILWHGPVDDASRYFAAFDLFVLSSRTEGTPIVLFEAMGAGIPIVATRVGGVPDVVGEREAWIVPPDRPADLAEAIREALLQREEASARARAARERLEVHFGLDPWLLTYERLYQRIQHDNQPVQP